MQLALCGHPNWYLTDTQSSIRNIIDNSGAVQDAITYDSFGNITAETNPGERGRYAWTGRELDVETGLQYNRARMYDAIVGRWISQDPLGFDAGDSNLYRYVHNEPTNFDDPSGLELHHIIPRQWWGTGPDSMGFSGAARGVFKSSTLNAPFHIGWGTPGHVAYNEEVGKVIRNYLRVNSITPANMTALQAEELVRTVRTSGRSKIASFLRYIRTGRTGAVDIRVLGALGVKAICVLGVTYGYDEYFAAGQRHGERLVEQVGLGRALQLLPELPANVFKVQMQDGRWVNVQVVQGGPDNKWYFTAWETVEHWSIISGSWRETRTIIGIGDVPVQPNLRDVHGNPIIGK